jgi:hypothetical protein
VKRQIVRRFMRVLRGCRVLMGVDAGIHVRRSPAAVWSSLH